MTRFPRPAPQSVLIVAAILGGVFWWIVIRAIHAALTGGPNP